MKKLNLLVIVAMLFGLLLPLSQPTGVVKAAPIGFTILHTNDFHGQLEASGSNPGLARVAQVVNDVRTAVGTDNVLLLDGGDEMQGSLLSNIQKGEPVIASFNLMGYAAATFGNHEFDWGKDILTARTGEADYPYLSANIVEGECTSWTPPAFATPYVIKTVAGVDVGIIGVTSTETPTITVASATEGLSFCDPADSIVHYYDAMLADGADVIVVLSHLGYNDGGYGYGIPVYGDQTLATKLNTAGKPANLIVGGHSHTDVTTATVVGSTTIVQAHYNGRKVGRADVTFDPDTKAVTVTWQRLVVSTSGAEDPAVKALISTYTSDPDYQATINAPVGYVQTDLLRDYNGDNMMGNFIDDSIYNALNNDTDPVNDMDMFFNNAGGIRIEWCDKEEPADSGTYIWTSTAADCQKEGLWAHDPMLLNYGQMFQILPFGNATIVGDMTGAQIMQLLNQSATLYKGAIQPSGIRYSFYRYTDSNPGPQPYAWGAFDVEVYDKATSAWVPLDLNKTYRVGTNEFLAPAGQDGYVPFKYMTNISYWGDMLNAVNDWVTENYTAANPYKGPNGDGLLDGRITRDGTDAADSGSITPITILHHNDSHGNLVKGTYVGYTQLATLIKQERLHNPTRTILLSGGDNIQGDAMMYYFKSAPSGFAADGTPLPEALQTHPLIAAMNAMSYDAVDLGNHEFNFGGEVFRGIFAQTNFPVLGANVTDSGEYGLADAQGGEGIKPYVEKTLGDIKVGILGLTNHRVPNYELPSNIVGLTFGNPIDKAVELVPELKARDDVVIALTHFGFTTNPKSVEVDNNVDTNLAGQVSGIDAIVGAHSHTNPANPDAPYKFLPTIVANPDGSPVLINQAYRYNNTLGETVLGVRAKVGGGYEVVARAGQYISVPTDTVEDAAIKAIVDPYVTQLTAYNGQTVGNTTAPIDTLQAFTQETNGANLQADAAVWELAQKGITDVDFHLSGAMTNKLMASGATPGTPVTLKISDMFGGMPYENSLVVMRMNGPQLKAVLERAYRNYYYYKYVPEYGGYSHYTTCMIDINNVGRIYYKDTNPTLPDGNNVAALVVNGKAIDFTDADTYYNVSTVNYLAAGSCNFNDEGVSLWPLNQITHDTQYYVRDAVIDYIKAMGTVSPAIEGRLLFGDTGVPEVTITNPEEKVYKHYEMVKLTFGAEDVLTGITPDGFPPSGLATYVATLDGKKVTSGVKLDLLTLPAGEHTLTVTAADYYGNSASEAVTFEITTSISIMKTSIARIYGEGKITKLVHRNTLVSLLNTAQSYINRGQKAKAILTLKTFINRVNALSHSKQIAPASAKMLVNDAQYIINGLR